MLDTEDVAIPKGETILITGVNGYVGSHIADQVLAAGYKVRGVVRNAEKSQWLEEVFDQKYKPGEIQLVEIANLTMEGALDEAVKGVSGVIHVATIVPLSRNPDPYIPDVTALAINTLKSAAKEPRVKRFVITSSSMAAADPAPDIQRTITVEDWNEKALKEAWEEPLGEANLWNVYGASKANSEREAWRWVKANKPHFVLNTVLPNTNFGPTVSKKHQGFGSTGKMLRAMYEGNFDAVSGDPPQYFVDIRDTAILHVIALLACQVQNERLFAFAAPYNWNIILAILRDTFPNKTFPADRPGLGNDISHYPNARAGELLGAFGQPGWKSLEQSIIDSALDVNPV